MYHITGGTTIPAHGGLVDFTGTVTSVGPDLTIGHAAEANFHGNPVSVQTLFLGNGTFRSTAPLDVSGSLYADGNSGIRGSGAVTVGAGAALTLRGFNFELNGRALVNRGSASWEAGWVVLWNAAEFHNEGTLAVGTAPDWFYSVHGGPVGAFVNTGTITRAAGPGFLQVTNTRFDNHGTVVVEGGTWFASGGTSSGAFQIAAGASIVLDHQTLTATSSVTGGGNVTLIAGTVGGAYNVSGHTHVYIGTVTFSGASGPVTSSFNALTVHPGTTLRASNDLQVGGEFTWAGGTLQGVAGQGSLTVLSDMTLNGTYNVRDFHLINAGNAVWSGGNVRFYGDSSFTNLADATLEIRTDGTFGSDDGRCIRFDNAGLLRKTAGTGITHLNVLLYNRGTVQIEQGQLALSCGYVQTNPGTPPDNFIYPPGGGPGFEDGGETSIGPGDPTPVFSTYTQTVTGVLVVQIAGHTPPDPFGVPGTDYGQIIVSGSVELAGSLQVELLNGFTPTVGDQFRIIDNRGSNAINTTAQMRLFSIREATSWRK